MFIIKNDVFFARPSHFQYKHAAPLPSLINDFRSCRLSASRLVVGLVFNVGRLRNWKPFKSVAVILPQAVLIPVVHMYARTLQWTSVIGKVDTLLQLRGIFKSNRKSLIRTRYDTPITTVAFLPFCLSQRRPVGKGESTQSDVFIHNKERTLDSGWDLRGMER